MRCGGSQRTVWPEESASVALPQCLMAFKIESIPVA